jgi:large subunit ribosomal protein L27
MAHRKAGGSTDNGRDSKPKFLGVKKYGGQKIKKGEIIVRQRGTKFRPSKNTKRTNDDTIIAMADGTVKFISKKVKRFTGILKKATFVDVEPK